GRDGRVGGGGARVAEEAALDVLGLERLPQQRVPPQVEHAGAEVHGRAPVGVHPADLFGRQSKTHDDAPDSGLGNLWMCRAGGADVHTATGRATCASCSLAAATTAPGVKPNFFCNSFSGAEAPNVCMPIMRPVKPTYPSQPNLA